MGNKLEKIDSFTNLFHQLEIMEKSRKVDLSVIGVLDGLVEDCRRMEKFWIENEQIPVEDSYLLYHATRNSRLIFGKMKERFVLASEKHENPKVIEDSLMVAPLLGELHSTVVSLMNRVVTPELQFLISHRLRLLRNIASNVSMLPSPEEEMKGIDRRKLKRRFNRFTNTLQAMLVET